MTKKVIAATAIDDSCTWLREDAFALCGNELCVASYIPDTRLIVEDSLLHSLRCHHQKRPQDMRYFLNGCGENPKALSLMHPTTCIVVSIDMDTLSGAFMLYGDMRRHASKLYCGVTLREVVLDQVFTYDAVDTRRPETCQSLNMSGFNSLMEALGVHRDVPTSGKVCELLRWHNNAAHHVFETQGVPYLGRMNNKIVVCGGYAHVNRPLRDPVSAINSIQLASHLINPGAPPTYSYSDLEEMITA